MPRRKLSAGLGRLVTNTLKLVNRIFGTSRGTPTPRPRRPTPPDIQQTVITKPPVITSSPIIEGPSYQNEIDELKKIIEQQQREIEKLKAEREELRQREVEEIEPPFEIIDNTPDEEIEPPFEIKDEEIEPPFEIIDDTAPGDELSYTFEDLGSKESLDYLTNFLKDTDLSGISPDSPFFDMSAIQQQFILIDYVQYQHDANPSLFYEGKKKVDLVNVPIWGAEFDRFIDNMTEFGNTNTGDGRFDDILPDWVNDLIEEY